MYIIQVCHTEGFKNLKFHRNDIVSSSQLCTLWRNFIELTFSVLLATLMITVQRGTIVVDSVCRQLVAMYIHIQLVSSVDIGSPLYEQFHQGLPL